MPITRGNLTVGDQKRLAYIFGIVSIFFVLAALVLTFWMKMHEVRAVWALVEFFLRTVMH